MAPGHTLQVDGPRPHTLPLIAPGHTLSVEGSRPQAHILQIDGPRPQTLIWWPQATLYQLMAPGHILGVIWAYLKYRYVACSHPFEVCVMEPSTKRCVAWGHLFKVCGLEPSTETVWSGSISNKVCGLGPSAKRVWGGAWVWPGAIYLKCGLGPST